MTLKSHNEHTNDIYKMKKNFNIKFIINTMMTFKSHIYEIKLRQNYDKLSHNSDIKAIF